MEARIFLPNKHIIKEGLYRSLFGKGKIAVRFRNVNVALFALAFFSMVVALLVTSGSIIRQVSADYAEHYAASSAYILSTRIIKEIDLMAKVARSKAVIEWFTDEYNNDKKLLAYEEMSGIIGELYSNNLYVGLNKSLHEYKIDEDYTADNIQPFTTLDENNSSDSWYFECITSGEDYLLGIGIDHVLQRKRVWLNYKVMQNGVSLGVICTGLDFFHMAGELFSQYDNTYLRGLIVGKTGVIHMDSSLLGNEDFLHYDLEERIQEEFSDSVFLAAIKSHLHSIDGYFKVMGKPIVIEMLTGPYRYAAIAPIRFTDWSAVILYDSSSLFGMSLFLPVIAIMLILLIAFAFATNAMGFHLIFMPLEKLVYSLARLKENKEERIYGIERDDEFGTLSNTIQDLFTEANYDALTGIYNRRFMESKFHDVMDFLSRSGGSLSVLMIDIDYFKKYNDTYGHEKGDICLKAIAQTLADTIPRANDFVARYGGEEFVVVLPNTDKAGAYVIAEKMLENVRMLNIPHANSAITQYVTISIGVTTCRVTYTQSWEEYLKCADEALYMSKKNGRNLYTYLDFTEKSERTGMHT